VEVGIQTSGSGIVYVIQREHRGDETDVWRRDCIVGNRRSKPIDDR
jgi:hypothetical protein